MVMVEEYPDEKSSEQNDPRAGSIHELQEGNEAQVLFVLLLTIRHIIDSIIYDHPRFYKEAIAGPGGEVFQQMLSLVERTEPKIAEYCLFVIRSDNTAAVMGEFNKVLMSIYNTFLKVITMEGAEQFIHSKEKDDERQDT